MLELADQNFKIAITNMSKNLDKKMGKLIKAMENFSRKMET